MSLVIAFSVLKKIVFHSAVRTLMYLVPILCLQAAGNCDTGNYFLRRLEIVVYYAQQVPKKLAGDVQG